MKGLDHDTHALNARTMSQCAFSQSGTARQPCLCVKCLVETYKLPSQAASCVVHSSLASRFIAERAHGLQVRATIVSSSDWNRVPAAALKIATPNAIANSLLVDPLSVFANDGTDVVNITDMHFRCARICQAMGWVRHT